MPLMASAATLSTAQVNAIVELLQAFGVNASTIQAVYADLVPSMALQSAFLRFRSRPTSYPTVAFSQYQSDSAAYLNAPMVIEGVDVAYLPRSGAGTSNFIETTNLFDPAQPRDYVRSRR